MFKFSSLFVAVCFVEIVLTKQSLRSETTFENENEVIKASINRDQRSEERINLSFPGTKW